MGEGERDSEESEDSEDSDDNDDARERAAGGQNVEEDGAPAVSPSNMFGEDERDERNPWLDADASASRCA
jgi:hypothetical protein